MKNDIKTYAGFWQRTKAFVFDYLVIAVYLIALTLLFLLINSLFNISSWLLADRVRAQVSAFLILTLPVTLYFAISESSIKQATWGKQKVGLVVTDHNRDRISFLRSLARTALKFIPWEISHTLIWQLSFYPQADTIWINFGFMLVYVLIGLNIASLVIAKTNQTIYDFLSGTYVINRAHETPPHQP